MLFLGFRDLSSFITPGCHIVIFSLFLNGEIPLSGIFSVSFVNTVSYWSANASAFAVAVVNNLLWCFNVGMPVWSHLLLLIKDQRFFVLFPELSKRLSR